MAKTTIPVELSSTPGITDNSNATAITIDSSERVGIGTGSPGSVLDINANAPIVTIECGSGQDSKILFVENGSNAASLFYEGSAGSGTSNNFHLRSELSGGEASLVTVGLDGKVGIGNTAPLGKLTISNAAGQNAPTSITAANTYLQLGSDDFGPDGNTGHFMIGFGYTDATNTNSPAYIGFQETSTAGDTKGELIFLTRDVVTDSAPTERLRITDGGYIGIGTASPARELDVQAASGWAELALRGASGSGGSLEFWTTSTKRAEIFADTEDIVFRNTASNTERMRIHSTGAVTKPTHPAFHAYGPSSATSGANVIYQNTYANSGNHYSTTNGRFTAPVAGVYLFFWSAIGNNNQDVYRFFLYKNGSVSAGGGNDIHLRQDTLATGSEYATNGSRVQMLSLAANDYVNIYFAADSNNGMYVQSDYANFGGYLIG